ncbi:hypothetical protein NUW58_g2362 [Xylaria curta]|uniref:Uncharacterized protein n=1 Tax=Xylaria curta TaxID=42375 RepID=A0ACC1PHP7_9PEZI|nr:hypothetical protein NUW58_g2362 [Xylaria curta]
MKLSIGPIFRHTRIARIRASIRRMMFWRKKKAPPTKRVTFDGHLSPWTTVLNDSESADGHYADIPDVNPLLTGSVTEEPSQSEAELNLHRVWARAEFDANMFNSFEDLFGLTMHEDYVASGASGAGPATAPAQSGHVHRSMAEPSPVWWITEQPSRRSHTQ